MTADTDVADAPTRLRAALDAAADGPVPPAWDAIVARVEAGEQVAVPPRHAARWLPVAAAVALVAGGVVLAVRAADDPDPAASDDATYCEALARPARAGIGVMVYLDPDVTAEDVDRVRAAIEATGVAQDLEYRDREESYAEARELFADEPAMLDLLRPEDVPTSFWMTVADDDAAAAVRVATEEDPATDMHGVEVEPRRLRDLYAQVAILADSGSWYSRPLRPIDPAVLDAFVAAAPADLSIAPELAERIGPEPVGQVATRLRQTPPVDGPPDVAASAVVMDAATRCGRDASEVLGDDADTATTTEPG